MSSTDLEAEYDNRALVPDYMDHFNRWDREAEAYRRAARQARRADLGLSYGTTERQTIDLFMPTGNGPDAIAIFIHGGYWRSLEPSMFSHMAKGLNAKGLTVAVVGYDLCPQVRVSDIIRQVRQACLFLFWRYGQRMLVSGHSAGGHLAACMVATDWSALDDGAPPDMIPSGLAISGVFDLAPLLGLPQNQDLRLTPEEARQVSPIHWEVGPGRALDIAVGGAESPAFRAQSRALADAWSARGVATTFREIPGANHFTALDPLPDANGDMVRGLVAMAQKLG